MLVPTDGAYWGEDVILRNSFQLCGVAAFTIPRGFLAFGIALIVLFPAAGRTAETIDLATALAAGLSENAELRAARAALGVAQGDLLKARLLLPANPSLETAVATDEPFANEGERDLRLGVAQEIEIGGQRGLRIKMAEADYAKAQARVRGREQEITARIKATFFTRLTEESQIVIQRELVEFARRLADAAMERAAAGDIAQLDTDLFVLEHTRARAELERSEAQLLESGLQLALLIGRSDGIPVGTAGDYPVSAIALNAEALMALALETRGDWLAARLDLAAREQEVLLRKRERIPNPTLGVDWARTTGVIGRDGIEGDPAIVQRIDRLRDTDQLLGLRIALPLPIIDWKQAELTRALADRSSASASREGLHQSIVRDVLGARQRLERAQAAFGNYAGNEERIARDLALLERAYREGEIDVAGFLTQSDRLFRLRFATLEARNECYQARTDLERAVGKDL